MTKFVKTPLALSISITALLSISSVFMLTGCHSKIIQPLQSQTISVIIIDQQSNDILQTVTCRFTDDKNNAYPLNKNPGSVTVPNGNNKFYLSCQAPDYYQSQIATTRTFTNWTYRDLTLLPGFVIDQEKFPPPIYPSKLIVFMNHNPLPSEKKADIQFNANQEKELFFQGTQADTDRLINK